MGMKRMSLLTREAILQAQDLKHEDVSVPEWGGTVRVRQMTGAERDALGASLLTKDKSLDMTQYRIRLLATCIVDDQDRQLFGMDEIHILGAKSGVALDRVYRAAERLNDTGADSLEAAEKN